MQLTAFGPYGLSSFIQFPKQIVPIRFTIDNSSLSKEQESPIKGYLSFISFNPHYNELKLNLNLEDKDYELTIDLNFNQSDKPFVIYKDETNEIYLKGYLFETEFNKELNLLIHGTKFLIYRI